jgi:hypothetical protein
MLGGSVDDKMEHVDVMVAKAFAMVGFIRRLSLDFRDPYTLKSLWFVQNWNTQVACGTLSMMFVLMRAHAAYSICFAWFETDMRFVTV